MEQTVHHSPNGAGHEQSEVSVRLIVVSLAFLAVATGIVLVLVVGIFRYFYDTYSTEEATRLSRPVVPPEPRIEVAPYEQLQQLRVKEDHVLNTYAWVDKHGGIVRVPIDQAIDMLAAKGLPSHNYLDDILAGRKPAAAPKAGAAPKPPAVPKRPSLPNKEVAMRSRVFLIAGFCVAAAAFVAAAQQMGIPAATVPMMVQGVGIDQNLNAQLPLELTFRDETGQTVRLGQYFREKPVVLALVYYECPGLCDLILNGLSHTMQQISLNVGTDYDVVTVSFNPKETWQLAQAKKANYVEKYSRPGAKQGWHFLTGDQAKIKTLADTVGFHYKYDPSPNSSRMPAPSCDYAGRQDLALLLRDRLQPARLPPGPGGSFGQQDRLTGRPGAVVLLPLRSHHRKIRTGHHARHPRARHGHRSSAGRFRVHHAPAGPALAPRRPEVSLTYAASTLA